MGIKVELDVIKEFGLDYEFVVDAHILMRAVEDVTVDGISLLIKEKLSYGSWGTEYITVNSGDLGSSSKIYQIYKDQELYYFLSHENNYMWVGTIPELIDIFKSHGGDDFTKWSWCGTVAEPPQKRFSLKYYIGTYG